MDFIGKYKIFKQLGAGGFGAVYLCHDSDVDRDVAIKVFRPTEDNIAAFATSGPEEALRTLRERFVREARILGKLDACPHVINVLEFGELDDGSPWYAMTYMPRALHQDLGSDIFDRAALADLEEKDRPRAIPHSTALEILEQVLIGLSAAHKQALVHRDIKPANILLDEKGQVRIADFGIAKAPDSHQTTVSQMGIGSRNYMAPEQRESAKHVDARADVYSVGVLAYRMLTGKLPTGRYVDPNVTVPAIGNAVNSSLLKALSEDKEQRQPDAAAFLEEIQAAKQQLELTDADITDIYTDVAHHEVVPRIPAKFTPLYQLIERALVEHGSTDVDEVEITAMSKVLGLDEEGLSTLIEEVKTSSEEYAEVGNLFHLLQEVAHEHTTVSKKTIKPLLSSAKLVGKNKSWVEKKLKEAIQTNARKTRAARTKITSTGLEENNNPAKSRVAYIFTGMGVIALALWFAGGVDFKEFNMPGFGPVSPTPVETMSVSSNEPDNPLLPEANVDSQPASEAVIDNAPVYTDIDLQARTSADSSFASDTLDGSQVYPADIPIEPEMIEISAGSFQMGDLSGDGFADERPVHPVTIALNFALGKYEVTFAEYDRFVAATGADRPANEDWGRGNSPVINISWYQAKTYAQWLSQESGKTYRLPREAEWEYAARAGSNSKYNWGNTINCSQARYGYSTESCKSAHSEFVVGGFQPNGFGLHDMHGNVWEWVEDCFQDGYSGASTDGSVWETDNCNRVLRGGGWDSDSKTIRVSTRSASHPDIHYPNVGFRLASDL